jgi:probable biosynthetic protein (TIGR04098 family)
MTNGAVLHRWAAQPASVVPSRRDSASWDAPEAHPLRVGMPHLNAGGLSESWLFGHAGDRHWQALGARWGGTTDDLRTESGARLYPTFLAVRANYRAPLSTVAENDDLATQVTLSWGARGYTHSFVTLTGRHNRLRFEMLTMLAARSPISGELRAAQPAAGLVGRGPMGSGDAGAPGLVALAKSARNGERHADAFAGDALARPLSGMGRVTYRPSPYSDFNGAGLLYFASYVAIADTAERQMAHQFGWLAKGDDWALSTSTLRRDVFYYANIRLGESVSTHLLAVEWADSGTVKTHLRMVREADGRSLADLVTRKKIGCGEP